jgi:hypothetical protein
VVQNTQWIRLLKYQEGHNVYREEENIKIVMDSAERETIVEPIYTKPDSNGRVYISRKLANKEILVIVLEATVDDKIKFLHPGRRKG